MALEEIKTQSSSGGFWHSLKGALAGFFIILPLSFVVVYFASQREQASEVLKNATPYQKGMMLKKNQPVYITGKIKTNPIGDDLFLKPGNYLIIHRNSEIYAYQSEKRSEKFKEGDQEKTKIIYECKLKWVSNPEESIQGKGCESENKKNPKKTINNSSNSIQPSIVFHDSIMHIQGEISYAANMPQLNITSQDLSETFYQSENYFYKSQNCIQSPYLGCERIYYTGIAYDPQKDYTAIASVENDKIIPFVSKSGSKYIKVGEGNFKEVITSLEKSDAKTTLILFVTSVILFWVGTIMILNPLLYLVEYIPVVGKFGAGVIRFILLFFAIILMGITFLVIEYWYFVLILGILLILALVYWLRKKKANA
ncbi:MAG: TMEM43 family protein [Leptonema sp. (in: bacteria)]